MKTVRPKINLFRIRILRRFVVIGLSFLLIQSVPFAETGSDNIFISLLVSVSAVESADVYGRLYTYVAALMSILVFPLWPAVARSKADGDIAFVVKLTRIFIGGVSLAATAATLMLLTTDSYIIAMWTGQEIELAMSTRFGFAFFAVITCVGSVQSMVLSGLGGISAQTRIYLYYIPILISAKIAGAVLFGVPGMVWAMNICYTIKMFCVGREISKEVKVI